MDFFRSELVVGTALSVERKYRGGELELGDGVTLVLGNISGCTVHCGSLTYIGRKNDGGRRKVQLGRVEVLA